MATIKPIEIKGLKEAVKNAKKVDNDLPKEFRKAGNKAADLLVAWIVPRVPKRSGKAAGTVKAASTQKAARVRAGGPKAPYYPWLDWGGRVGRNKSVKRKFYSDGRYIYPGIVAIKPDLQNAYETALAEAINGEIFKAT